MAEHEKDLREKLWKLYEDSQCMPLMVRLAWHDSGTFDAKDGSGGANASIRFQPEIGHACNNGLKKAIDLLEPFHEEYDSVSYADLFQLASVVAIEFTGGPKIPFRFGRKDEFDCTDDGRIPDGGKRMSHLRDIFYRMGFNDKEIVVLSGAHCLGRAHKDRSGFDGPWTEEPLKFDNTYFKQILAEEPSEGLLRMPSDAALTDEEETKKLVEAYAKDQELFFKDYVDAHIKLSELGFPKKVAA
eukprot:Plantae.Rhodophyta-Purpureofilum_apyrenoidigerum.ctg16382.p1 GENE.Plantae.Rhodophyta-Purpureofilum_apyrenoidigerum.ctg16382~~Plantae.Rhodophyta-Purpureofilum_apyrenoidigerum.ctg16382.p1  ORF type:complete len:259 (-),score=54.83 Plantae.Rhodophyta-Purpureofilum_apyrenoidigerum.ctg16382:74-802(-)